MFRYHSCKLYISKNGKLPKDNSFSLVSDKKVRFEVFPDIDLEEWKDQLEEFKQEHEDRKNDTDKLTSSGHPQWDLIHEKSDSMRRKFRKSLRVLSMRALTVFKLANLL